MTGNSQSVKLHIDACNKDLFFVDANNMLYAGTKVVKGEGIGLVVNIGTNVVLNYILNENDKQSKEYNTDISEVEYEKWWTTLIISIFALSMALIVMICTLVMKKEWTLVLEYMVMIIISFMPEGLLVLVSLNLVLSGRNAYKNKFLVDRLDSMVKLGNTDCVCTDLSSIVTSNNCNLIGI